MVGFQAEDIVTYDLPKRPGDVRDVRPQVIVDGDLAVVYGLSQMRGDKKDRGPIDSWNRRTVV